MYVHLCMYIYIYMRINISLPREYLHKRAYTYTDKHIHAYIPWPDRVGQSQQRAARRNKQIRHFEQGDGHAEGAAAGKQAGM